MNDIGNSREDVSTRIPYAFNRSLSDSIVIYEPIVMNTQDDYSY